MVVDNVLTWQSIPPGIVEETPDGRRQRYFHDFFNYAGLHRTVWLYDHAPAYVSDVTVVTGLDGSTGTVGYEVDGGGATLEVGVALRDAGGAEVARATGAAGELTVEDVHRGGRARATSTSSTSSCRGTATRRSTSTRCRSASARCEVDGTRFLINGEPFYFKGFGKHEDSAVRGKGHDDAFMVHDFALMEWLGANSFRTSHYPYAEEVLDYADRHGIVVIDETAAVGHQHGPGRRHLRRPGPFRPSRDETINDATQEVHARRSASSSRATRTTRASCCGASPTSPSRSRPRRARYFEPLAAEARRLDPTRPVGFVNLMRAPPDRDVVTDSSTS